MYSSSTLSTTTSTSLESRILSKTGSLNYPASSGVRFSAAQKLQALRNYMLDDEWMTQELAYYVAPNGQSFPGSESSEPLAPWVQKELIGSHNRVLLLKGPGGAGKSTFNRHLMRQIWQGAEWRDWKPGQQPPSAPAPLFIPLGSGPVDPRRLFAYLGHLPEPLESFSEEEINVLKADYSVLIIADGYDEIPAALRVNLYDGNDLDRYEGRVKLLITSRVLEGRERIENSLFVPHRSDNASLLDWRYYKERYISPFSESQIADYLKQYVEKNKSRTDIVLWPEVTHYQQQFAQLPELKAIVSTPFMLLITAEILPMIVQEVAETLPDLRQESLIVTEDKYSTDRERKIEIKEDEEEIKHSSSQTAEHRQQRRMLTRAKLYHCFMEQWFNRQAQKAVTAKDILEDPEMLLGSEVVQSLTTHHSGDQLAAELLKQAYARFCQTFAGYLQAEGRVSIQYPSETKRHGRLTDEKQSLTPTTEPHWPALLLGSKEGDWVRIRKGCPLYQDANNQHGFIHASLVDYFVMTLVYQELLVSEPTPTDQLVNTESKSALSNLAETSVNDIAIDVPASEIKTTPIRKQGRLQRSAEGKSVKLIGQYLFPKDTLELSADDLKESGSRTRSLRQYYNQLIEQSKTDEMMAIAAANSITILVLANESFSGRDLRGIKVPDADLSGGIFHATQLQGSDLRRVHFTGAYLEDVNMEGCQLEGIILNERPVLRGHSAFLPITCMAYDKTHNLAATERG